MNETTCECKVPLIADVTSLDTSVCDIETGRFAQET